MRSLLLHSVYRHAKGVKHNVEQQSQTIPDEEKGMEKSQVMREALPIQQQQAHTLTKNRERIPEGKEVNGLLQSGPKAEKNHTMQNESCYKDHVKVKMDAMRNMSCFVQTAAKKKHKTKSSRLLDDIYA